MTENSMLANAKIRQVGHFPGLENMGEISA